MSTAAEIQALIAHGNSRIRAIDQIMQEPLRRAQAMVFQLTLIHIQCDTVLENIKRMEAEGLARVDRILFG